MTEQDTPIFQNELKFGHENIANFSNILWLKVEDTGVGLDGEELQKVFDRFYRVTDAEQDGQPGSGIGLAFVRSLMALHRGCVSVYSEKNKGTAFYIGLQKGKDYLKPEELLVADETRLDTEGGAARVSENMMQSLEDTETPIIPQNPTSIGKPRLLIVEDNAELRQFLAESFAENYHISLAEDGEEGLKMAQDLHPDIIISDIMMPNMDGIELCKIIRQTLHLSHTPIILLTAKNSVQSRIDGAEAAADAYIAKPFSLRLLLATVKNLLESRRQLKERYAEANLIEVHELATNQRDREFLQKMMDIIEKNIEDTEFDVEKIGRAMGLSRTVLYDKVSAMTGKSVGEFIRKTRIHTAARILVTENLPVNLVMDKVGIQSASYFSKAFKKEFGKTPSQYLQDFLAEKKAKDLKELPKDDPSILN